MILCGKPPLSHPSASPEGVLSNDRAPVIMPDGTVLMLWPGLTDSPGSPAGRAPMVFLQDCDEEPNFTFPLHSSSNTGHPARSVSYNFPGPGQLSR